MSQTYDRYFASDYIDDEEELKPMEAKHIKMEQKPVKHQRLYSMQVPSTKPISSEQQLRHILNSGVKEEKSHLETNESDKPYLSGTGQKTATTHLSSMDFKSDAVYLQLTKPTSSNTSIMNMTQDFRQGFIYKNTIGTLDPISDGEDMDQPNMRQFTIDSPQATHDLTTMQKKDHYKQLRRRRQKVQSTSALNQSKLQQQKSPEKMKDIVQQSVNRLYSYSKQREEKINYLRKKQTYDKQVEDRISHTFKPVINKSSVKMVRLKSRQAQQELQNRTIQEVVSKYSPTMRQSRSPLTPTSNKSNTLEQYIQERESSLTFKPQILKKSVQIVANKRKQSRDRTPTHENLYQDANHKKQRLQLHTYEVKKQEQQKIKDSSFTPPARRRVKVTDENQTLSDRSQSRTPTKVSPLQHAHKLHQLYSHREQKLTQRRAEQKYQQENYDEKGQKLYKPKIKRGPRGTKDLEFREKLDICTRLYFLMYVHQEKKRDMEEREYLQVKEQANKRWTSENSQKLFERLQLRKLKEIFTSMDADNDGQISESNFINSELAPETVALLRPMVKNGKRLDMNQFLEQLQEILASKSGEPLGHCLLQRKKSPLTQRNENLVEKMRQRYHPVNWHM